MNITANLFDKTLSVSVPSVCEWSSRGLIERLTLIGASSSKRMGWEMKISRALVQRYLISVSKS